MNLSAIMASFRGGRSCIWVAVLIGFLPVSVLAESAQAQAIAAARAVVTAGPQSETGAALTDTSTVLKTPTAAVQALPLSTAIQGATQQSSATGAGSSSEKVAPRLNQVATPSASTATTSASVSTVGPAKTANPATNATSTVQLPVDDVELLSPSQQRTYRRAASAFTSFCHDWERLLHEREVNNLEHLSWRTDGGMETASYTGYGKVESCECKASKEGLPIGKIRYEEIIYSIAGKSIDEARHAAPKLMHEINTLEIFSWDKGKWFY